MFKWRWQESGIRSGCRQTFVKGTLGSFMSSNNLHWHARPLLQRPSDWMHIKWCTAQQVKYQGDSLYLGWGFKPITKQLKGLTGTTASQLAQVDAMKTKTIKMQSLWVYHIKKADRSVVFVLLVLHPAISMLCPPSQNSAGRMWSASTTPFG